MHPPPDDVFQQVPWFASTASGEVDLYASVGYSSPGVARESRKASLAESTAWHKKEQEEEEQERRESLPDKVDKVEKIDIRMSAVADRGYRNPKALDANRYATKKTIAQGMLDVALLTANASQLKYVLQVGEKHEFYTLMLGLIIISIILQVIIGVLSLSLNLLRDCYVDDVNYKRSALGINYFSLGTIFIIAILNLFIAAFQPHSL